MAQQNETKHRIGIAIEMGQPFGHHHGCYKGILNYVREHHPDWLTVVDPYMTGLVSSEGKSNYDGIVGRITRQAADQAKALGIPAVTHWMNSPVRGIPGVFTDYVACGRIVAEHFLSRGYERIGFISWSTDRARPLYLKGLNAAAKPQVVRVETLDVQYDFEDHPEAFVTFYEQLRESLEHIETPIGLYVPMDGMALYVIQLCHESGLRIPHDVGLAVAYNSLEVCLNTRPTLTSIEADNIETGYVAMQTLAKMIRGETVDTEEPQWIAPQSIRVRGSSEVFVSRDGAVSKAMHFITENARRPISVDEVAEAAGVSKRTLSRRFEEHVGHSVHNEISRVRLQNIKQTLIDTDLTINEVATECGFVSTSHFNVFFRKAMNQSPGEYRKSLKPAV